MCVHPLSKIRFHGTFSKILSLSGGVVVDLVVGGMDDGESGSISVLGFISDHLCHPVSSSSPTISGEILNPSFAYLNPSFVYPILSRPRSAGWGPGAVVVPDAVIVAGAVPLDRRSWEEDPVLEDSAEVAWWGLLLEIPRLERVAEPDFGGLVEAQILEGAADMYSEDLMEDPVPEGFAYMKLASLI